MRGIVVTALMAAALHAGGAAAESSTIEKDIDDCSKIARIPPAQVIAACTRLLAEPEVRYWKKNLVAGIHSDRAYAYHKLKSHRQAVADLDIAIGLDPSDVDNYLFRGRTHADLGDQQSAIRDYAHCIRLKPSDSICHNNRGASYLRLGNYARAISNFSAAIRFDPKYASAYGSRGYAHEMSGHRQAAIRDYRKALQLGASHAEIPKRLAALEAGATPPSADPEPPARVQPPPGTPVDFTFRFRNNAGGIVRVKMYTRARNIWWPGARTNWRMDGVGPYSFTISCRHGEKVCYGAWRDEDTEKYWGTGFQDRYGCDGCCYICVNGQSRIHNLNP